MILGSARVVALLCKRAFGLNAGESNMRVAAKSHQFLWDLRDI